MNGRHAWESANLTCAATSPKIFTTNLMWDALRACSRFTVTPSKLEHCPRHRRKLSSLAPRPQLRSMFYALMATLGAVIGGYITYALARKGGKQAMERKLSKPRAAKVYATFERWGFWAVAVPALLPPPFPFVPFLIAAGALQYSREKFLGALTLGRLVRYSIVAGLGALYGTHIVRFFSRYYKTALIILIGLAVVGGMLTLIQYFRWKKSSSIPVRP